MNTNYYFSFQDQLFNIGFDEQEVDKNYTQVDKETYALFFSKVNSGCLVLSVEDQIFSSPKPSDTHAWNGDEWIDNRTPEQIRESELKALTPLTRRQFRMVLVLNGYDLDEIKAQILAIEDIQTKQLTLIEWEDANTFERTSPSLVMMAGLLQLNEDQVNAMWKQALML